MLGYRQDLMTVYSSYLSLNGHQNDWMINIKEWREMNSSVSTDLHDYVKEEMSSSDAHFHIFANDIFNLIFCSQNVSQTMIVFRVSFFNKSFLAKFEDTKGVIRSRKSKDRQYNDQTKKKRTKGQTMIWKMRYRKLNIV